MFKKGDVGEKSRSLLKKQDSRKIRGDIVAKYDRINDDELNQLITAKTTITEVKLQTASKLYCIDDVPYFIKMNTSTKKEDNDLIVPTIFTLWKFPHMIRTLLIHPPVSSFVLKGADLMLPGLITLSGLEGLQVGEVVCIRVYGNPLPFAVGTSACSWDGIQVNGKRGKAVNMVHYYGDGLSLMAKGIIPNSGFGSSSIYSIDGYQELVDVQAMGDDDDDDEGDEDDKSVSDGADDQSNNGINAGVDASNITYDETVKGVEDMVIKEDHNIHDDLFVSALLKGIKYIIKDKQLPMLASAFWTIILRCETAEKMDIKQTSFKKVGTFLQSMESRHKLIKLNERNGVVSIVAVERISSLYKGINVDDPEAFRAYVNSNSSSDKDSNPSPDVSISTWIEKKKVAENQSQGAAKGKAGKVSVTDLYKLKKSIQVIFGSLRGQHGVYLKASEIREALLMYIKSKNLEVIDDKAYVSIPCCEVGMYKILAPSSSKSSKSSKSKVAATDSSSSGSNTNAALSSDIIDEEYTEEYDDADDGHASSVVAGVWMGSTSSSSASSSAAAKLKDSDTIWKPVSLATPAPIPKKSSGKSSSASMNGSSAEGLVDVVDDRPPIRIRKDDLMKTLLDIETSPYFAITLANGLVNIVSGAPPSIDVSLEMRMGKKTITRVRGLESFGIDMTAFTKECQKKFACSASLGSVLGIPKEKEITIQGHLSHELEVYLNDHLHIPKHLINITIPEGIRSKKK